MFVPAQLDPGRSHACVGGSGAQRSVLVVDSCRYVYGNRSAEQYYSSAVIVLGAVAFFLMLLMDSFSGWVATDVLVLSYVASIGFLVTAIQ